MGVESKANWESSGRRSNIPRSVTETQAWEGDYICFANLQLQMFQDAGPWFLTSAEKCFREAKWAIGTKAERGHTVIIAFPSEEEESFPSQSLHTIFKNQTVQTSPELLHWSSLINKLLRNNQGEQRWYFEYQQILVDSCMTLKSHCTALFNFQWNLLSPLSVQVDSNTRACPIRKYRASILFLSASLNWASFAVKILPFSISYERTR